MLRTFIASSALALWIGAPALGQDAPTGWSIEHYEALSTAMDVADADVLGTTPGSEQWRAAMTGAVSARRTLLDYLDQSLAGGAMPAEFVDGAARARLLLVQNLVVMSSELGLCSDARADLAVLAPIAQSEDPELSVAYVRATAAAAGCTEPVVELAPEPARPELFEEAPRPARAVALERSGQVMVGVGAAAFVGGWIWDIVSAMGPRDEFSALEAACSTGSATCDVARRDALAEQIDASRAPIGALVIGGGIVGASGAALWVAGRRLGADRVAVGIGGSPVAGQPGATVHVRF